MLYPGPVPYFFKKMDVWVKWRIVWGLCYNFSKNRSPSVKQVW